MKIEKIIDELLSHNVTKFEAIEKLKSIVNGFRNNDGIEMSVDSVSSC